MTTAQRIRLLSESTVETTHPSPVVLDVGSLSEPVTATPGLPDRSTRVRGTNGGKPGDRPTPTCDPGAAVAPAGTGTEPATPPQHSAQAAA